jgi:hypothetical protein
MSEVGRRRTIVLISCVKTKRSLPSSAKDLYCSLLFEAQRDYAEAVSNQWFILSAKYGLLEPDEQIAPYEKTLKAAPAAEKKVWTDRVWAELERRTTSSDLIVITAGEDYCHYLLPLLHKRGYQVQRPLKGLAMGFQPGRLRELTAMHKAGAA